MTDHPKSAIELHTSLQSESQVANTREARECLIAHLDGRMSLHDLCIRVHAETGFEVQSIGEDRMTLTSLAVTPLNDIVITLTIHAH